MTWSLALDEVFHSIPYMNSMPGTPAGDPRPFFLLIRWRELQVSCAKPFFSVLWIMTPQTLWRLLPLLLWPQNIKIFTLKLLAASKSLSEALIFIWTVANFIYFPSILKIKNSRIIKFGEWTETCTLAPGVNISEKKADFQGIHVFLPVVPLSPQ